MTEVYKCSSEGCEKDAKLQCPTCIKLKLPAVYFCTQECFKANWNAHKVVHKTKTSPSEPYDPWPDFRFTGPLRPFPQTPKRNVPDSIEKPDYALDKQGFPASEREARNAGIEVLNDEDQEKLRVVCRLGREVLDEVAKVIDVGVTTDEIDKLVHEACIERECYPSPLNYYKFPKSCCTSLNEVICHGIPDLRPLKNKDIFNVDISVYHRGFHGDLNETFLVGEVEEGSLKLVRTTYECLDKAAQLIRPGIKYREIGDVIQKHAQSNGFSVVRTYCGHGIHRLFHTAPSVPHYAKNKAIGIMKPGHAFTIEPMISEGTWKDLTWPDNWTAVTTDGKFSAQFEQTFLVTEEGVEILTRRRDKNGQPYFMDNLKK